MSNLKTAFELMRDNLNDLLVTAVFPNKASLSPKHPDYVELDQQFPYFGFRYKGENPQYSGSDFWWITPSEEMATFEMLVVINQSGSDSLSADLMAIVKQVRDSIIALTRDRSQTDFRCRVDNVRAEYEASARWAMAVVTITIGAYGV